MAYIYKHIRKDTNEVFYIGIGEDKYRITSNASRNSHWKNIVNKVGYDAEIIDDDLTWEQACSKEIEFIKYYGRKDLNEGTLVNMTNGGEGTIGAIHTLETKEKIGNALRGKCGKKHTDITKIKIGNKSKGREPWNKGTNISDETKIKIANTLSGRKLTDETKTKMRKPKSEEHRRKISEARKKMFLTKDKN
jgi:hypothetical protein